MGSRQGPPKHQNKFAWVPKAGVKINETEVGGRFRPLSEITGVCYRCREQIAWKRRYGKYKTLTEATKCFLKRANFFFLGCCYSQKCTKRNVRQAYHKLCPGCAKEQKVCAKCCSRVDQILGRDIYEVEAEQKMLDETIKNARERDRRTLLRAMNKDNKPKSDEATRSDSSKVGDVFPSTSLEEYANKSGRVSGSIGHGIVSDHGHDDEASGPESDEDRTGDDEHDLREDSDATEPSQLQK
ncbi:PREDICTED: uncharacterized protein C9orf85 homolog isoform X1 [Camelina sativa]|uniref:Uncharacterized protein C9orf85 homolog isoform X1 n=1 Tax=Camelina sativa TaxID=90675 RepID=A0ABM0VSC5_CAMSA|nr:PREDICTED: uncharacterized protein C9orf85 homolog isoform X1 [Camelina sativa]